MLFLEKRIRLSRCGAVVACRMVGRAGRAGLARFGRSRSLSAPFLAVGAETGPSSKALSPRVASELTSPLSCPMGGRASVAGGLSAPARASVEELRSGWLELDGSPPMARFHLSRSGTGTASSDGKNDRRGPSDDDAGDGSLRETRRGR